MPRIGSRRDEGKALACNVVRAHARGAARARSARARAGSRWFGPRWVWGRLRRLGHIDGRFFGGWVRGGSELTGGIYAGVQLECRRGRVCRRHSDLKVQLRTLARGRAGGRHDEQRQPSGAQLPDYLAMGDRRGERPKGLGLRHRSQTAPGADREAELSQGGRVPEVPRQIRRDRSRLTRAREGRTARVADRGAGHQRQERRAGQKRTGEFSEGLPRTLEKIYDL